MMLVFNGLYGYICPPISQWSHSYAVPCRRFHCLPWQPKCVRPTNLRMRMGAQGAKCSATFNRLYTRLLLNIAMALIEIDGLPNLKMVIFHGYVKQPEGKYIWSIAISGTDWLEVPTIYFRPMYPEFPIDMRSALFYARNFLNPRDINTAGIYFRFH